MNPLSAIPHLAEEGVSKVAQLFGGQSPDQSQPQQPQNPNFLERLLPTAGGIIGSTLGANVGAPLNLLDAVSGPVGTAGDVAVSAAGGALGGSLGKELENKLTGAPQGQDVGASAAQNAIGGGAGTALGKAAGGLVGNVIPNALDKVGGGLFKGQFGKTLSSDAAQTLYGLGARTDNEVGQIAQHVTGAAGAYPQAIRQGLADAEDAGHVVDLTGITDTAKQALEGSLGVKPNTLNQIGRTITDAINQGVGGDVQYVPGLKGATGTFTYNPEDLTHANPTTIFDQVKKLQGLASSAYQKSRDNFGNITNAEQDAVYQALHGVGKDLEGRVFGSSGAQIPLSDGVKQTLTDSLAPIKDINSTVYNNLVKSIPDSLQGLRPVQAPFVQGSQALNAMGNATDKGIQMGDLVKSNKLLPSAGAGIIGHAVLGPVGAAASILPMINPNVYERAGAQVASKAADLLPNVSKILPTLTRSAVVAGANLPNDVGQQPQTPQSQGQQSQIPQGAVAPNNVNMGAGMEQNPLAQLYNEIISQSQSPTGISGNLVSTANTLAPVVQRQELAAPVINNLLQTYQGAGGAQGMGGGLLSRLTGFIPGTAANTYQRQQEAASSALGGILGIHPAQAQSMFPQLMQSQQTAAPQIQGLQSILGGIAPTPAY